MRFASALQLVSPLLTIAACSGSGSGPDSHRVPDDPDAAIVAINCDDASFRFVAPQPGLHYDTNLVVTADMSPYYADNLPGAYAVDDLDRYYEPTAAPTTTTLPSGLAEMRWPFALAPDRRYELHFMATECDRQVTFFTSSQ